ncbi:MAG: biotin--[acetyl-CoA-carboxylase] ligase, partial [Bacteroidota bacterium]
LLTQAISIGVVEALHQVTGLSFAIKWPNDIYINRKKVAGMLIQMALAQRTIQYAIVGIGLNVNQLDFPNSLPNPTSLSAITKSTFDRAEVLAMVLEYIERWYLNLRSGQTSLIEQRYQQLLFQFGEWALYRVPGGEPFSGKIVGLTSQGKLEVETQRGIQIFNFKEMQFLT